MLLTNVKVPIETNSFYSTVLNTRLQICYVPLILIKDVIVDGT